MEREENIRPQRNPNSRRRQVSAFQRYRIGWILLGMLATAVAVVLANGSVAALVMLPLIVGAFILRSALVEDYRRRQAEDSQEL